MTAETGILGDLHEIPNNVNEGFKTKLQTGKLIPTHV